MPFSQIEENETFIVAFHLRHEVLPMIQKALAAVHTGVRHLKSFKLVLVLFSNDIKQVRIFTEKDIHEIVDYEIKTDFQIGNDLTHVFNITQGFINSVGYKRKLFVFNTVHLHRGYLTDVFIRAMHNITWLHEFGWKDCEVGNRNPIRFHDFALNTLFDLLESFVKINLNFAIYDDDGNLIDIKKIDLERAIKSAKILVDRT